MAYSTEKLAGELKAARLAKGLSQRALSGRAGVPQSHISKIERGGVDLRHSSLVEIARALGLEVTLVPREHLAAVRSITRRRSSVVGDPSVSRPVDKARPAYSVEDDDHG